MCLRSGDGRANKWMCVRMRVCVCACDCCVYVCVCVCVCVVWLWLYMCLTCPRGQSHFELCFYPNRSRHSPPGELMVHNNPYCHVIPQSHPIPLPSPQTTPTLTTRATTKRSYHAPPPIWPCMHHRLSDLDDGHGVAARVHADSLSHNEFITLSRPPNM